MEERIINRRVSYYLINIKARHNQTTRHYVEAFRNIASQDPLIGLDNEISSSMKHLDEGEFDSQDMPVWMKIDFLTYNIIDPEAFYNRRSHEDVSMSWDSDIVANKKESSLYFIPSVHIVAYKKSSKITLTRVLKYLNGALYRIEPNEFDVTIIPDHDEVNRIIDAHSIVKIETSLMYSNPFGGHSTLFSDVLDDKIHETRAKVVRMEIQGSSDTPLHVAEDGLVKAVVKQVVTGNGTIDATIREVEGAPLIHINSAKHPRLLMVEQFIRDAGFTLYNQLKTIFSGH